MKINASISDLKGWLKSIQEALQSELCGTLVFHARTPLTTDPNADEYIYIEFDLDRERQKLNEPERKDRLNLSHIPLFKDEPESETYKKALISITESACCDIFEATAIATEALNKYSTPGQRVEGGFKPDLSIPQFIPVEEPERVEGETKQDRVRRLAGRIAKDLGNCLFCDYGTNWSWDKLNSVLEDMKTLANAEGQPIKIQGEEHKMSAQEIKEVADLILKDDMTRRATKRHNLFLIGQIADILSRSENEYNNKN